MFLVFMQKTKFYLTYPCSAIYLCHMKANTRKFVNHVRNHLAEYGFTLHLGKGRRVNSNEGWRAEGFFDAGAKCIKVGRGGIQ